MNFLANMPSKKVIKDYQAQIRAKITENSQDIANLTKARGDLERFNEQIVNSQEPHYSDTDAIDRQARLAKQLELAQNQISNIEVALQAEIQSLRPLVNEASDIACKLLLPVVNQQTATITDCLLPFSHNRGNAEMLAKQSDCFRAACAQMSRFNQLGGYQYADECFANMSFIDAVLTEALKDTPDMVKFFPFNSTN